MGGDQHAAGAAGLGDLLHHDGVGEHVEPRPFVLLRNVATHEAHGAHLLDQLFRDLVLFVDLYGKRLDLLLDEVADAVPQYLVVLAQFEIHLHPPVIV